MVYWLFSKVINVYFRKLEENKGKRKINHNHTIRRYLPFSILVVSLPVVFSSCNILEYSYLIFYLSPQPPHYQRHMCPLYKF